MRWTMSIPCLDNRGADAGDPEHRGPEGCAHGADGSAQTVPNPGDWTGVTEEPGEKHAVSTYFIYPHTTLKSSSALSLQVARSPPLCWHKLPTPVNRRHGAAGSESNTLTLFSPRQKASLEGTLRDTELRYNMEVESLNSIILGLEAELTQLRNNIQLQTQDYESLLNTKMKLEAEIATYRRLLDGGDFKWVGRRFF